MMLELDRASIEDKHILRSLLEFYKYDSSEFDGGDVNSHGLYGYKYLDHYWTEDGRHPILVRVNGNLAGFALVRQLEKAENGEIYYSIAEFFVMKKYRRKGVGRHIAFRVFDMFEGNWKVAQVEENEIAKKFWRKTIGEYTNNNYEEIQEENWNGPIQRFSSPLFKKI